MDLKIKLNIPKGEAKTILKIFVAATLVLIARILAFGISQMLF